MTLFYGLSSKRRVANTEPLTWTSRTSGHSQDIYSVCYDGSSYWLTVSSTSSGYAQRGYTTDPTTSWTVNAIGGSTYGFAWDAECGNSNFTIVGRDANDPGYLGYTTDVTSTSWTFRSNIPPQYYDATGIAYNGSDLWVLGAEGGKLYSGATLAGTFTQRTSNLDTGSPTRVVYKNSLWVACAGKTISTSTDGTTWTLRYTGSDDDHFYRAAYGNGKWIAVGDNDVDHFTPVPIAISSTNGTSWSTVTTGFSDETIYGVGYGNGSWVIAGSGGYLYTSTDGSSSSWTSRTSNFGGYPIRDVIYDDSVWVAVGSSGKMSTAVSGV